MVKDIKISAPIALTTKRDEVYEFSPVGKQSLQNKAVSLLFVRRGNTELWDTHAQRDKIFKKIWVAEQDNLSSRTVVELERVSEEGTCFYAYRKDDKFHRRSIELQADESEQNIAIVIPTHYKVDELSLRKFHQIQTTYAIIEFLKAAVNFLLTPFAYLYQLIAGRGEPREFANMLIAVDHDRVGEITHDAVLSQVHFMARLFGEEDLAIHSANLGLQEVPLQEIRFMSKPRPCEIQKNDYKIWIEANYSKVMVDEKEQLIEIPTWIEFDKKNDADLINRLRQRSGQRGHKERGEPESDKVEIACFAEWITLPKTHSGFIGQPNYTSAPLRDNELNPMLLSATQEVSGVFSEAFVLGKEMQEALNSGNKRKSKAIALLANALNQLSSQKKHLVLPLAQGEGREYLPHFLVFVHNEEQKRILLKHICFSGTSLEKGKMKVVTTYDVTETINNGERLKKFVNALFASQPYKRAQDAKETGLKGPMFQDRFLDKLLLNYGTVIASAEGTREKKSSRDPVKALFEVVQQLQIKENPHLSLGDHVLERITASKAKFYAVYVNHLIAYYEENESRLRPKERIHALDGILWYANQVRHYMANEVGVDTAIAISDHLIEFVEKKLDEVGRTEALENEDVRNLKNKVSLFSATLTEPLHESLQRVETTKDVEGSRISPKECRSIKQLRQTLDKTDLGPSARIAAFKLCSELLEIGECYLKEKNPLAAKTLLIGIMQALPPADNPNQKTFWDSLEEWELEFWTSRLANIAERTMEASLRSGTYPLKPHEVFEFNVVIPLIQRYLLSRKIAFMKEKIDGDDGILKKYKENARIIQNLNKAHINFMRKREKEIEEEVREALRRKWKKEDDADAVLIKKYKDGLRVYKEKLANYERYKNDPVRRNYHLMPSQPVAPNIRSEETKEEERAKQYQAEFEKTIKEDLFLNELKAVNLEELGDNWDALCASATPRMQAVLGRFARIMRISRKLYAYKLGSYNWVGKTFGGQPEKALWLMQKDCSVLVGSSAIFEKRYAACKRNFIYLSKFQEKVNSTFATNFIIGYAGLGDGTQFENDNELLKQVQISHAGFFNFGEGEQYLAPAELADIRKLNEMRKLLSNPVHFLVPFSESGIIAAIKRLFTQDTFSAQSLQKKFSEMPKITLVAATRQANNGQTVGCFTLSKEDDESGFAAINDNIEKPATCLDRRKYIGQITPEMAEEKVGADRERQKFNDVIRRRKYLGLDSLQEFVLRESALTRSGSEKKESELSYLSVSQCMHFIYQFPEKLELPSIQDTLFKTFLQQGLIRHHLYKNPAFFIQFGHVLNQVCKFLQKKGDTHLTSELFIREICSRIRRQAFGIREELKDNYNKNDDWVAKIDEALPLYDEDNVVSLFLQKKNTNEQKIFATYALSYYCQNRPGPQNLDGWRNLLNAYYIIQKSPLEMGHSGFQAELLYATQHELLPPIAFYLAHNQGARNTLLQQLTGKSGVWINTNKPFCYRNQNSGNEFEVDLRTGKNFETEIILGTCSKLPEQIRSDENFKFLFKNLDPMVVSEPAENGIIDYRWKHDKSGSEFILRYHTPDRSLRILQVVHGTTFQFQTLTIGKKLTNKLGDLFACHSNKTIEEKITSNGVWLSVDKDGRLDSSKILLAQHGWNIEKDPITLTIAKDQVKEATIGKGKDKKWICSGLSDKDSKLLSCRSGKDLLLLSKDKKHVDEIRFPVDPITKEQLILTRSEQSDCWVVSGREDWVWQLTDTKIYEKRFGNNWRNYILPLKNKKTGEEEIWIFPHLVVGGEKKGTEVRFLKSAVDFIDVIGGDIDNIFAVNTDTLRMLVSAAENFMGGGENLIDGLTDGLQSIGQIPKEGDLVEFANLFKKLITPRGTCYRIDRRTEVSSHAGFFYLSYVASLRGDWGAASRYLELMLENGSSSAEDLKQLKSMVFTVLFIDRFKDIIKAFAISSTHAAFHAKIIAALLSLNTRLKAQHGIDIYSDQEKQEIAIEGVLFYQEYRKELACNYHKLQEHGLLLTKREEAILTADVSLMGEAYKLKAELKKKIKPGEKAAPIQLDLPASQDLRDMVNAMADFVQPAGVWSIHDLHKKHGSYPKWETVLANFWSYWEWIYLNDLKIEDIAFLLHETPPLANNTDAIKQRNHKAIETARRSLLYFWHYCKQQRFSQLRNEHDLATDSILKDIKAKRLEMPDFASMEPNKQRLKHEAYMVPTVFHVSFASIYEMYVNVRKIINELTYSTSIGGVEHRRGPRKDFIQLSNDLLQTFLAAVMAYDKPLLIKPDRLEIHKEYQSLPETEPEGAYIYEAKLPASPYPRKVIDAHYETVEVKLHAETTNSKWENYFIDSLLAWDPKSNAFVSGRSIWDKRVESAKTYFNVEATKSDRERFKLKKICAGVDEAAKDLKQRTERSFNVTALRRVYRMLSERLKSLCKDNETLRRQILDFARIHATELGLMNLFADRSRITDEHILQKIFDLYRYGELGRLDDEVLQREFAELITEFILVTTEMQQYKKAQGACKDLESVLRKILDNIANISDSYDERERLYIAQTLANRSVDWLLYSADLRRFLEEGSDRLRYAKEEGGKYYLRDQQFTRRYLVSDVRNQWISRKKAISALEDMLKDITESGRNGKPVRFIKAKMGTGKSDFIFPEAIDLLMQKGYAPLMITTDDLVDQLNISMGHKAFVFKFSIHFGLDKIHEYELSRLNETQRKVKWNELTQSRNIEAHVANLVTTLNNLQAEGKCVLTSPSQIAALRDKRVQLQSMMVMLSPGKARQSLFRQLQLIKKIEAHFKKEKAIYLIDEDVNIDIRHEFNFATGEFRTIDPIRFEVAERIIRTIKTKHHQLWELIVTNNLRAIRDVTTEFEAVARDLFQDTEFWQAVGWKTEQWKLIPEKEFIDFILGNREMLPSKMPEWDPMLSDDKQQEKVYVGSLKTFLSKTLDSVRGINPKLERGVSSFDGVTIVPFSDGSEKKGVLYGEESENILHHIFHYGGVGCMVGEEIFMQKYKELGALDLRISPFYPDTWRSWAQKIGEVRDRKTIQSKPEFLHKDPTYIAFIHAPELGLERIQFLRHLMLETDFIRVYHQQITFNSQDLGLGVDVRVGSGTGEPFALNLSDYTDGSAHSSDAVLGETLLCLKLNRKTETFNGTPLEHIEVKALDPRCIAICNYDYYDYVVSENTQNLASHLRQKAGKQRQIIFRTQENQELVKKIWNSGDHFFPMRYEPEAIDSEDPLFLYSRRDARGLHFHIPRGKGKYGQAMVGVGNKDDDFAQLAWRMRHLDMGHDLRVSHDKKTEQQIRATCQLQPNEPVTIGHAMRYFTQNTINEEDVKNVKASIFKGQTPLKTFIDAEVRKPYDMTSILNSTCLEALEGEAIFYTTQALYILTNRSRWMREYQAHKSVDPINFMKGLCQEELKKIELMERRFNAQIEKVVKEQDLARMVREQKLLRSIESISLVQNDNVNWEEFEKTLSKLLDTSQNKFYQIEEIAIAREILRKVYAMRVAFVKARYALIQEIERLEKDKEYKNFLKSNLPEKIAVDIDEAARNEQKVEQLQEQKREEKQEKLERILKPFGSDASTSPINYDHFKCVALGERSIEKTTKNYVWKENGNFLPLNIILKQEMGLNPKKDYENTYISQRAWQLIKVGVNGAPTVEILVFEDQSGKCHSVIITPAEREETVAKGLIRERQNAANGNSNSSYVSPQKLTKQSYTKEDFWNYIKVQMSSAAGYSLSELVERQLEGNKSAVMLFIGPFLDEPTFETAWTMFTQSIPNIADLMDFGRFANKLQTWIVSLKEEIRELHARYHKAQSSQTVPSIVNFQVNRIAVYPLSNENFSRMVIDCVQEVNEQSNNFIHTMVMNKLFLNWTQFTLDELEYLIDMVLEGSGAVNSLLEMFSRVHGFETYQSIETGFQQICSGKTAELIKQIRDKEPKFVLKLAKRKLDENYLGRYRQEEDIAIQQWVRKLGNIQYQLEYNRLVDNKAHHSASKLKQIYEQVKTT